MIETNANALPEEEPKDVEIQAEKASEPAVQETATTETETPETAPEETPSAETEAPGEPEEVKPDPEAEKKALREKVLAMTPEELLAYLDGEVSQERLPEQSFMNRLKNLIERGAPAVASETSDPESEDDEETAEEETQVTEEGGEGTAVSEELQVAYINLHTRYQQLKNDLKEKDKKEREENLRLKEELLVKLEETLNSTGDFFKIRNERNNIVTRWREIGPVPEGNRTSVLDRYAKLNDQFYHQNKLEKEAMEEDYRHNRREKEGFIARAKELGEEEDIEKAFRELQSLHDRWKEVGPVAPEFRDAMWAEFKEASTLINRKFDQHHQELHKQYEDNFEQKKGLIERLENMLIELPKTREAWRKYETEMDGIRTNWKAIGRVPKDKTRDTNLRFRQAVDEFYLQRRTFMKELSAEITPKLEKMRLLVAEAESLKESTEWRKTTDRMLAIQQEWKEVSNLGANVGEANRLWRQLRQTMDHFFGRKREDLKAGQAARNENLEKKRDVAERLKALWEEKPADLEARVTELQAEWDAIGPMPDAKKDEVMNLFYGTLREIRGTGSRKGSGKPRSGEGRRGDRRDNRPAPAPKAPTATTVDLKKDVTNLDTKALQEERKTVKKAIAEQNEELRKLETNLGFFSGSTDNPMFAHVQQQKDRILTAIKKYEDRLEEIKSAIKNASANAEAPAEEEDKPDDGGQSEQSEL